MIHPHTEIKFINEVVGYGVVATRFIPKGTITWVLDKLDIVFEEKEILAFDENYREILDKYCFRDNRGRFVLCWDIAKIVNHSFRPSCMSTAYDFEFAIRDIYPGEELTDDYGYLNVTEPLELLPEEGCSRTHVMPDDLLNFHEEWDELLIDAFLLYNKVEQPLLKFLNKDTKRKADEVALGKRKMDSILNCYYDERRALAIKSLKQNGNILKKVI